MLHDLSESECVVFEDHLAGCPACAEKVSYVEESLRRMERDSVLELEPATRHWILGRGAEAALAAAVVILLLGYPAFLGLHRLPQVERQARRLERRQAETQAEHERNLNDLQARTRNEVEEQWRSGVLKGVNDVHHLSRPARGGAPVERVLLRGDEVFVILGVELEPDSVTADGSYHFDIHTKDGKAVWSAELSGRESREYLKSSGEIFLPVPAERLPAGDYELRVTGPSGAGSEELLTKRFTVARRP